MKRIDAINQVLFYVNEARINSLDDMTPEAQDIDELLTETTREVCIDEQTFNIEPRTLTPDENGIIKIGEDILSVDTETLGKVRVIAKKLFNIESKTYVFTDAVEANCKILYTFEDLEDAVQDYITKKTIFKKVSVDLGNRDLVQAAGYALEISNLAYKSYNLEIADYNFLENENVQSFSRYYDGLID